MIVLSEDSPQLPPSASAQSLHASTEAARLVGCRVYYIPQNDVCETAAEALAYVPTQERETPGVWQGYIPSPEWYEAIYAEALSKNLCKYRFFTVRHEGNGRIIGDFFATVIP